MTNVEAEGHHAMQPLLGTVRHACCSDTAVYYRVWDGLEEHLITAGAIISIRTL